MLVEKQDISYNVETRALIREKILIGTGFPKMEASISASDIQ